MPDLEVQVFQWLGRTPWVLTAVAGIVLCMLGYAKHPRRCLIVGTALAIELGVQAAEPFVSHVLLQYLYTDFDANSMSELKWRIAVSSLVNSVPRAVALGLLLWAVFAPLRDGARSD